MIRGKVSIAGIVERASYDSLSLPVEPSPATDPSPENPPSPLLDCRVQSADTMSALDEDEVFDHQLPLPIRTHSTIHFTTVAIARTAARLLAPRPQMRVLDVGAGPGKFCLVAARAVPDATFVGVELRLHLVRLARKLAARVKVGNVTFIHADAMDLDWSAYDAFYLYNPFAEQLYAADDRLVLDRSLRCDPENFVDYVTGVRRRLSSARIGTRVVTYHGFGAPLPYGYELREDHDARLQLWVKTRHVHLIEEDFT